MLRLLSSWWLSQLYPKVTDAITTVTMRAACPAVAWTFFLVNVHIYFNDVEQNHIRCNHNPTLLRTRWPMKGFISKIFLKIFSEGQSVVYARSSVLSIYGALTISFFTIQLVTMQKSLFTAAMLDLQIKVFLRQYFKYKNRWIILESE